MGTDWKISPIFPIRFVVQVYEFHEKVGKVEKEKALNHRKQESNKKGCVGKFTEI